MKKLMSLATVFVLGIVLSGCDLVPEDVQDQLNDLLCEESPDDPLCNLESIEDLEEEVVMDLVEEVLLKAKEKANKTKCSSVIAPGSVELIEECAIDDFFFLPDEVDMFTPLTVTSDGMEYVITGFTDDSSEELVITLKVVFVDNQYYLEDWSYEFVTLQSNELTFDLVKQFVIDFVRDIQDPTISTDDFCMMYFDGEDNDCDGLRDEVLDSGQTIELLRLDPDDDNDSVYDATLRVVVDGEELEVVVEFEVFRQDFGPVQTTRVESTMEPVEYIDEVAMFFMDFLDDYQDPMISNEYISGKYFRDMMPTDFLEYRMEELEDGIQLDFGSIAEKGIHKFYEVWIVVTIDGEVNDVMLSLKSREDSLGMYMIFEVEDGIDDDCDGYGDTCSVPDLTTEEVEVLFNSFIAAFLDPTITDETLNEMYFRGQAPESVFENRFEKIADEMEVVVLEVDKDNRQLNLTLQVTEDFETEMVSLSLRVLQDDNGLFMEWLDEDDDCDGVDTCSINISEEDVEMFFQEFVMDYFNANITNDEIDELYFRWMAPEGMLDSRMSEIEEGLQVTVLYAMRVDSFFDIYMELYIEGEMEESVLRVAIYEDEAGLYMEFIYDNVDDDCDGIEECPFIQEIDEFELFFNQFVMDYMNSDYSDDELLMMYSMYEFPMSFPERQTFIVDGHVTVLKMSEPWDTYFEVELEFLDGTEATMLEFEVRVNRNDMALMMWFNYDECFELGEMCDYMNDETEMAMFLESFIESYMDPTYTDQDIFDMYGLYDFPATFPVRQSFILDGHVTVLKAHYDYSGFFDVELEFVDGNAMTMAYSYEIRVNRIDMALRIHEYFYYDECMYLAELCEFINDDDELKTILESFLIDYLDPTYSDDELLAMYDLTEFPMEFPERQSFIVDGHVTVLKAMYIYDGFYGVELEFDNGDGSVMSWTIEVRVNRIDMAIVFNGDDCPDCPDMIDYDIAMELVNGFKAHYNGMSILSTSVCSDLVDENMVEDCAFDRDQKISDGFMIESIELFSFDGYYEIEITYASATEELHEYFMVDFIETPEGYQMKLCCYGEILIDGVELEFEFFIIVLENSEVPADQACYMVSEEDQLNCEELNSFIDNSGFSINSIEFRDGTDGQIVTLMFNNQNGEFIGEVEYLVDVMYTEEGNSVLYVEPMNEGLNPLYEPN